MAREIFKHWLKEFCDNAHTVLYHMGEDGDAPSPCRGDRFFLSEKSSGDSEDKIFMWSANEEGFCYWNEEQWSWLDLKPQDVPANIVSLNETPYPR